MEFSIRNKVEESYETIDEIRSLVNKVQECIYDIAKETDIRDADEMCEHEKLFGTINDLDDLIFDFEFGRDVEKEAILKNLYECRNYFEQRSKYLRPDEKSNFYSVL